MKKVSRKVKKKYERKKKFDYEMDDYELKCKD